MNNNHPPLLGYADQLSARPGETVEVKVSSYLKANTQRVWCVPYAPTPTLTEWGSWRKLSTAVLRAPMQHGYSHLRQDLV